MRDQSTSSKAQSEPEALADDTCLQSFNGQQATISYSGKQHAVSLKLKGIYNIQNATAAVALVRAIMGEQLHESAMFAALSNVTPAFGRGEDIVVNGQPVELVLVKNPSGFRMSLASFPQKTPPP